MAAKTIYLGAGGTGTETDPGADAFTTTPTGWIVSTGAGVDYSPYVINTEQAASTFGATVLPGSASVGTGYIRSPTAYTGTFAAGNWVPHFVCRANTNGGAQDGAAMFRLWKGVANDGSDAVEMTSAVQTGSAVTDLATSANQDSTVSIALGGITCTNEYIFWPIAWKRTGAGGMTSADVNVRVGTSGTRLVTPDFTASAPSMIKRLLRGGILRGSALRRGTSG